MPTRARFWPKPLGPSFVRKTAIASDRQRDDTRRGEQAAGIGAPLGGIAVSRIADTGVGAGSTASAPADVVPPRSVIEPIEDIRASFIDDFQKIRIAGGEKPAERAVFRKQHGVAKGQLGVVASCPPEFRVGLWAAGPYVVWIRCSSDAPPDVPDQKNNTLGFSLKLFGVAGPTLATDNPLASTADLIFQNSDIFFVDNARDMAAISSNAEANAFSEAHQRSNQILHQMAHPEGSLLAARFSSTLPYAIGPLVVKYRLVPEVPFDPGAPGTSSNYLAEDLAKRLAAGPVAFLLDAQLFVDDSVTPIDRATERWDEAVSPFRTVARLEIAAQDINQAGQAAYGEGLAFSPWRTLRENRPIGSIADARRIAYPASATVRRSANGQLLEEPEKPR